MRYRQHTHGRPRSEHDPDFNSALDAMTADELRSFLRRALDRLDDEPRGALIDALVASAAKGSGGWKPASPSERIVEEVKDFAESACDVGEAEAHDVDEYLRQGTKAFLAGEHATARGIFGSLLPPITDGTIYLGQHEMLDEVLTVSEHDCTLQYVVSVYATTPLAERVDSVCAAIDAMSGAASLWSPIEQMERVATEPLPELDAFLPLWLKYLEQEPSSESEWERDHDRWLREAVLRLEGVAGLERIALKTKQPEALRAWCKAVTDSGDWAEALRANDVAADLVGKSHWLGDFLDGAALAAQELGRRDATKRLEAAWLGAPSLVRLLRWLGVGTPTKATLSKRVNKALDHRRGMLASQVGLLRLLRGDVPAAAKILSSAPGLGWSAGGHPGHLLFPAFAGLLAEGVEARISGELFATLKDDPHDSMDMHGGDEARPKLLTPTIMELLQVAAPAERLDSKGRTTLLAAMRSAATKRVEGLLANKRRRHYGHGATLVACCLELASVVDKQDEVAAWVAGLRHEYSRFSAFQRELKDALASMSS